MQTYLKILVLKPNSRVVPMCLNYIMNVFHINREIYGLRREFYSSSYVQQTQIVDLNKYIDNTYFGTSSFAYYALSKPCICASNSCFCFNSSGFFFSYHFKTLRPITTNSKGRYICHM